MKAWQAMLVKPWQEQRQQRQLWFTALLVFFVIGAPLAVQALAGNWRVSSMVCASILLCIIFVWWGVFVRSAALQNHPANAVLVPGLRIGLLRLTAILWLALSLSCAAVGSMLFGHFGLMLCGFAIFLLYVIAVQRFTWLAFMPLGVILLNALASGSIVAAARWLGAMLGEHGIIAAGLVLNAVLAVVLLQLLFPSGGDRHHAWHARLQCSAMQLSEGSLTAGLQGKLAHALLAVLNRPYWRRFEEDVRKQRSHAAPQAIMLHVLGPRTQAGSVLACALVLGIVFLSTGSAAPDSVSYQFINVFLGPFALLPALLFPVQQRLALQRTAGEQALLRLSPGMPAAADFNRVLGVALARYFFFTWLLAVGVIAGAAMLATRSLWIPHSLPATAVFGLAAGAFTLRDYASLTKVQFGSNALMPPIFGAIALAAAASVSGSRTPWMWLTLAGLPVVAWLWWSRWQAMLAARPAFPAARG